jgi:hypothetical protein
MHPVSICYSFISVLTFSSQFCQFSCMQQTEALYLIAFFHFCKDKWRGMEDPELPQYDFRQFTNVRRMMAKVASSNALALMAHVE